AGEAGGQGLDHGHEIETEEGEVVQVVLGERLAAQVSMYEAQPAETAEAAPQAADVGERQAVGIADDDVFDRAVAREKHADLPVDLPGRLGQVAGELG